jgi:hypothetical protein
MSGIVDLLKHGFAYAKGGLNHTELYSIELYAKPAQEA